MIEVINVRGLVTNDPEVYYCGRSWAGWYGSVLANQHTIHGPCKICHRQHSPKEAVELFRNDLWHQIKTDDKHVLAALYDIMQVEDNIGIVRLGCWCKPKICHCDVIARAVEWLRTRTQVAVHPNAKEGEQQS